MRSNLATDPDVVDIAARVSLDEFGVVGRLQALWSWADQHSCDGILPRATSAFVDRLTACPGFAEALRQVGWLDGRDSALRLPNWDRHNGNTAKTRALEARKKQRQRDKCPDDCPPTMGTPPGPEKRREEKDTHSAREPEDSPSEPPGKAPSIAQFVAECARFSIPAWYAEAKHGVWETKAWRTGNTPIVWKAAVKIYVTQDYVNDGRPTSPQPRKNGTNSAPHTSRNGGHNAGLDYSKRPARQATDGPEGSQPES